MSDHFVAQLARGTVKVCDIRHIFPIAFLFFSSVAASSPFDLLRLSWLGSFYDDEFLAQRLGFDSV